MTPSPRVDVFLQYYRPHVSGLTNMAAELAEDAAAHGYDMHVHCIAGRGHAAGERVVDGVTVHAHRRTFGLGRASFSLGLLRSMLRLRRRSGIAHVHMPYPESFVLAAVLPRSWSIITTYHCDAPTSGGVATAIARALDWSHRRLLRRSSAAVTTSRDYALSSRLRDDLVAAGLEVVPATSRDRRGGTARYARVGHRMLGFMGRPTHEKGIDVLLEALELLDREDVRLLLAGPLDGLSEAPTYDRARLERLIAAGRVERIGFLEEPDIPDFYASLDLFMFPSVNSFEAFGIVQVEAISAGVPVIASALPGVRTIVPATGLGIIAPVGDALALSESIAAALDREFDAAQARRVVEERYLDPVPQDAYRGLYARVAEQHGTPATG